MENILLHAQMEVVVSLWLDMSYRPAKTVRPGTIEQK